MCRSYISETDKGAAEQPNATILFTTRPIRLTCKERGEHEISLPCLYQKYIWT